jgi:virulence-associated protein VagC
MLRDRSGQRKNGRNQAVRIPREFELPGYDAILHKEGDELIIEAVPQKSLLALLATNIVSIWPELRSPATADGRAKHNRRTNK